MAIETSFLSILQNEDSCVNSINSLDAENKFIQERVSSIMRLPDCEPKRADLRVYENLIDENNAEMQKSKDELRQIRTEIKEYFSKL